MARDSLSLPGEGTLDWSLAMTNREKTLLRDMTTKLQNISQIQRKISFMKATQDTMDVKVSAGTLFHGRK